MLQDTIDIERLNEQFDGAHPREVLAWTLENVSPVAIAASFQISGLVLVHMARELVDRVPVLFIQTGFHFPETLEFRDRLVREWNIDLMQTRPTLGPERQAREIHPELYKADPDMCCELNKVMPLQEILNKLNGWVTGIRRDQTAERTATQVVSFDPLNSGRKILKVAPLAGWNKEQVEAYAERHGVPRHPLYDKGYPSIGCAPCTRPVAPGEDERAGRWSGKGKTECGIHSFGTSGPERAAAAPA